MYGGDVERLLTEITGIKDETANQIEALAKVSDYQLIMKPHEHSIDNHSIAVEQIVYEEEHPISPTSYTDPIKSLSDTLGEDETKIKTLEKNNYTGAENFNNSYGSPWTEIYNLQKRIKSMSEYASSIDPAPWLGQKHSLLHMMQIVLTSATEAEHSLIIYQDYVQRGYDHEYNDNNPSIVRDNMGDTSIGNVRQDYSENVNIRRESDDPY